MIERITKSQWMLKLTYFNIGMLLSVLTQHLEMAHLYFLRSVKASGCFFNPLIYVVEINLFFIFIINTFFSLEYFHGRF